MTPDWLHQVLWFASGILATGAFWYFLSQKNYHATLWSEFFVVVAALLAVVLLIRNDLLRRGIQQEPFFVRIHTALTFGCPGLLVYRYKSKFGDLLAPVGFAVVVEVTNKLSSVARIVDYFVDMKVDDRWVRLPNLQALNGTEFFWINNGNFQTATRLDFRENGFDAQARLLTLQPGESVKGWMFFEWPPELRENARARGQDS